MLLTISRVRFAFLLKAWIVNAHGYKKGTLERPSQIDVLIAADRPIL